MAKKSAQRKPIKLDRSVVEAFESVNTPICITDSFGKIVYANSRFEDLLSYSQKDLRRFSFADLISAENFKHIQSTLEVMVKKGQAKAIGEMNVVLKRKSGRPIAAEVAAKPLRLGHQVLGVFSLHDLSHVQKLIREKESTTRVLAQATKLADIGKLTAGIAHELNNPLTIIQGFAENIQLLLAEDSFDKNEIRTQIDPIVRASDRMARIIATMMRLVRSEYTVQVHFDLLEVAKAAVGYLAKDIDREKIRVDFDQSIRSQVKGDPGQVEQIIINVVKNAVQAIPQCRDMGDGQIRIYVTTSADKTSLHIRNNGPEIPANIRSRIMSPFFTTKEVGEGTGLGLALSYGIMKSHGGNLSFQTSSNDGTEFVLEFPGVIRMEEIVHLRGPILVVEPNDSDRSYIVEKIHHFGFEVLEAKDLSEARNILQKQPEVFCVCSDIELGNDSGIEFIAETRQLRPDRLFVAITSQSSNKKSVLQAQRMGIDGIIAKPVDPVSFSVLMNDIEHTFHHNQKRVG